jgi:hypothetical protein
VLQDYLGDGEMTVALYERMAEGVTPDAASVVRPMTSALPVPVGAGGRSSGSVTT